MSRKPKCTKTYLKFLNIIIERELKEKDVSELDLDLCRSYAKSIAEYIQSEKEDSTRNPKLLLESIYHVR